MDPTVQLPHLLTLLDDPSPVVRSSVATALAAFGPDLVLGYRGVSRSDPVSG